MTYDGKRRAAFTLVEIATVMAGLVVAMAMGSVILAGMLRIQKASQMSLERTFARSALADQFRTDVAGSQVVLKGAGNAHASESCLILRGNNGCIVYQMEAGRIERQERSIVGAVLRRALLGPQADGLRFSSEGSNQRLITMCLEQSADKARERRTWVFRAALGGDRR